MEIDRDGICMIETSKLRELGVPIERIRSRTYRLFQKGREIPIYISNAHHKTLEGDDHILFYCEALRLSADTLEQYSQTNVYWLTWGTSTGSRVAVVSGGRRVDPTVYTCPKASRHAHVRTQHTSKRTTPLYGSAMWPTVRLKR
jgi:hypothetical protein